MPQEYEDPQSVIEHLQLHRRTKKYGKDIELLDSIRDIRRQRIRFHLQIN